MDERAVAFLIIFLFLASSVYLYQKTGIVGKPPVDSEGIEKPLFSEGPEVTVLRKRMVDDIKAKGVNDSEVLMVIEAVPRHLFLPENARSQAYSGFPLSIRGNRSIPQAYYVAYIAGAVKPGIGDKVLEVGSGIGYQTAVLASLAGQVYAVEADRELAEAARDTLKSLGVINAYVKVGDPFKGWGENAPYDIIIVNQAVAEIPPHLTQQLSGEGRIIIPLIEEDAYQRLTLIDRGNDTTKTTKLELVRFDHM